MRLTFTQRERSFRGLPTALLDEYKLSETARVHDFQDATIGMVMFHPTMVMFPVAALGVLDTTMASN